MSSLVVAPVRAIGLTAEQLTAVARAEEPKRHPSLRDMREWLDGLVAQGYLERDDGGRYVPTLAARAWWTEAGT